MFTEIYLESLLVDEDLADEVWELWDAGIIPDDLAEIAWIVTTSMPQQKGVFEYYTDRSLPPI